MREESKEVTNPETNEVRTETTLVPAGEAEIAEFETESLDELEAKCIELLGTYNKNHSRAA